MNRTFLLALGLFASSALADKTITVAADGSGDYKSVIDAVAAVPDNSAERTTIHIKPGEYFGQILLTKNKAKVTFLGDDAATTRITWNEWSQQRPDVHTFNPGVQVQSDDFTAENITFENTYGDHGQALALRLDGDRELIRKCRLIGWQDTLMINNGRDYFDHCTIAGRVDFIYGSATAWFEQCDIHSRNGGHVTAASTPQEHPFGYVFHECKLTSDPTPWSPPPGQPVPEKANTKPTPLGDLGRPWRPYASVTFLNCELDAHIKPEGWNSWLKPGETVSPNEKTARYAEYKSTGPGAAPDKRLPWTHQLSDEAAAKITRDAVVSGDDHWQPWTASSTQPTTP